MYLLPASTKQSYLKHVDGKTWNIATAEDNDNCDEDCCNVPVSCNPCSASGSNVPIGGSGKDTVDVTVEDAEKYDRNDNHDKEVADQDVISAIGETLTQLGRTKSQFTISDIPHTEWNL